MEDLIEALTIFMKYKNLKWPTHCEHDCFMVCDIDLEEVTVADADRLDELSFTWNAEHDAFTSYRFGSY